MAKYRRMKNFTHNIILVSAAVAALLAIAACGGNGKNGKCGRGMEYAQCLSLYEEDGYKVVEIADPWNRNKILQKYVLVPKTECAATDGVQTEDGCQNGRPNGKPDGRNIPEGTIIHVPIDHIIVYSSVHASIIDALGAAGRISGVCESQYITCQAVKDGVTAGTITDCGNSLSPNIERVADAKGEIIIATPFENSNYGTAEKLGLPIVECADYMETSPLARSEWIRLFGALLCIEDKADSLFRQVKTEYLEIKETVAKEIESRQLKRPTLLVERRYGSSWGIPGGNSYVAHLYADAGADYIFSGLDAESTVNMSFENVLSTAIDADIWLFKYWNPTDMTYSDLEAEYKLYNRFKSFREHRIYACNTFESTYYDDIVLRPQSILKDLTAVFHPSLTAGYTPRYFLPL